jgi:hypothetical protein
MMLSTPPYSTAACVVERGLSEFIIRFQKYGIEIRYTSMYKDTGGFFCSPAKGCMNEILERTSQTIT